MRTTIGIDIGTESIKIVCLDKHENKCKLLAYGHLEYKGDIKRLKKFIGDSDLPSGDIRVNIEDPSLKIRRLDLPQMTDSEISEAIKWGAKSVIEGDVDDYNYQYIRINVEDLALGGKIPLVIFAIKKKAVEERLKFVSDIGFQKPNIVEPNAGALASIFEFCRDKEVKGCNVLLDMGAGSSLFAVMGLKGLLFSRPLSSCAGSNLTDQIARDLGAGIPEADKAKAEFFRSGAGDDRLKNTVSHFFSRIAIEIQRSIDSYTLLFQKGNISHICLAGGGAYYKGFSEYLSKTIGIESALADPFKCIDTKDFEGGGLESKKALFAVACGLAVD